MDEVWRYAKGGYMQQLYLLGAAWASRDYQGLRFCLDEEYAKAHIAPYRAFLRKHL